LQEIANQLDEAAEQAPEEPAKPAPDANKF
jgi:hypothetical protein